MKHQILETLANMIPARYRKDLPEITDGREALAVLRYESRMIRLTHGVKQRLHRMAEAWAAAHLIYHLALDYAAPIDWEMDMAEAAAQSITEFAKARRLLRGRPLRSDDYYDRLENKLWQCITQPHATA